MLRRDGNLFLNLGDSYNGSGKGGVFTEKSRKQATNTGANIDVPTRLTGLANKQLLGVPWRVAFALQDDGWVLRSAAPWIRVNAMPQSVDDRLTSGHEYLFHFVKQGDYYYDSLASLSAYDKPMNRWGGDNLKATGISTWDDGTGQESYRDRNMRPNAAGRNRRTSDVYRDGFDGQIEELQAMRDAEVIYGDDTIMAINVPTEPSSVGHYAMFPARLIRPCIASGCPEKTCSVCGAPYVRQVENTPMKIRRTDWGDAAGNRTASSGTMLEPNHAITLGFAPSCKCSSPDTDSGIVLDPFSGAGTTALEARRQGRHYLGIELNPKYVAISQDRLRKPFEPLKSEAKADDDFDNSPIMRAIRGDADAE